MAETETGEEKTEKPTGKRRGKARSEGQVARSTEVSSVAVLLAGLSAIYMFASFLYDRISDFMHNHFSLIASPYMNDVDFIKFGRDVIQDFILTVAPVMGVIFLVAFLINAIQVGGIKVSWKAIKPKLSKMNPISGLKRVFISPQSLVELLKSVAKIIIVAWIAYITIKGEINGMLSVGDMEVRSIILYLLSVMFKIFIRVCLAMIFLAILDFSFKKWKHEEQLKMTKQEVKDERKQSDGDPQVKARIKRVQREMAMRRMMGDVPKADVIVTNPVHLAVALSYDSDSMKSPTVLAKGAGKIAERIKLIAKEHQIPIVENKELARSIYKMVEIGGEIPSILFQAVAEVLAYVYRLKGKV
ncbi:Flagellar biosynthetic protein FlhB [Candidatus Magnetomoraceae bacterium gMMP-15]